MSPAPSRPESALLDLLWSDERRAHDLASVEDPLRWIELAAAAERHRVTLRLERRLLMLGRVPAPVRIAAVVARDRLTACLHTVHAARTACDAAGVRGVFLKLVTTGLDVGRDLDLLVPAGAHVRRDVARTGPVLDVHCGALGLGAEHARFAASVLRRARVVEWQGLTLHVPALEDELLLLTLARVYARPGVRLGDLLTIESLLRDPSFDAERLRRDAEDAALLPGLGCLLDLADEVARHVRGAPIRSPAWQRLFPPHAWGPLAWRDGAWRPALARVTPPLFARLALSRAWRGEWRDVGALARLPFTVLADRRARRRARGSPRPVHA